MSPTRTPNQAVLQGREGAAHRDHINNTRDFGIGKRLKNLAALGRLGFKANGYAKRRNISHDPIRGAKAFTDLTAPVVIRATSFASTCRAVRRALTAMGVGVSSTALVPGSRLVPPGFLGTD